MKKYHHKLLMTIGIILIVAGGFGWGFTYVYDHRPCDNLSGYCDIDFKIIAIFINFEVRIFEFGIT